MAVPLLAEDRDTIAGAPGWVWEGLRGARLLITGGTGFVGTWLVAGLSWAMREFALDAEVTVLSRDPEQFLAREPWARTVPELRWVQGDVRELVAQPGSFSHVIAGAGPVDVGAASETPLAMMETIVGGGARTLRAAAGARSVLVLSSGAVYGRGGEQLAAIPEEFEGHLDRLDPTAAYPAAKRALETIAVAASVESGLPVTIARLFAFLGPWLPGDRHFAVGNFVRDGLAGGPIVVRGDGSPVRSYLYAADMFVWLLAILQGGVAGRAYNLGSDRAVSLSALAALVAAGLPVAPAVEIIGQHGNGAGGQRYVPDVTRAIEELGLRPTVTLEDGIERTVRWLQTHPTVG